MSVVVTKSDGEILAIFETVNSASSKAEALVAAVNFLGYQIEPTGRTGNGTIYRSDTHEIGFCSATGLTVGQYL